MPYTLQEKWMIYKMVSKKIDPERSTGKIFKGKL